MIKFKKVIATILCATTVLLNMGVKGYASEIDQETVFVDGMEFKYYTTDNGSIIVESLEDNGKSRLEIGVDGEAVATVMNEDNEYEDYNLIINELTQEDVDIVVTDENDNVVEVYDEVEDIMGDEYVGQAAIVYGTGVLIGTLVTVVLAVTATIVVGGLIYYAVSSVISKIQNDSAKQKYYYKAYIKDYVTYIAFYSGTITQSQAASRIKSGQNVYTYTSSLAKSAVVSAGLGGATSSEIHLRTGKFAFYHYHPYNRNGSHSLYGLPYTK